MSLSARLPWSIVYVPTLVGTVALLQLAPDYAINASYTQTFLTLGLALTILRTAWNVIVYPYCFSPLRHLPSPPGSTFFNGQSKRIIGEPMGNPQRDWINSVPNDGLIYYRTVLNQERIIPTNPQGLNEVLMTKSYDYQKPKFLQGGLGRILGMGLVLVEGETHKIHRKNLMPAFAFRHIKDLYPVFWSKASELVNCLMNEVRTASEKGTTAVVDLAEWGSRATLDIIGVAGIGQDFDALKNADNELNAVYRKIIPPSRAAQILLIMGLFLPQQLVRAIPVSHNKNMLYASTRIREISRDLISSKRAKMQSEKKRTEIDILSVALESGAFTDEELADELMTFLVAGHETTASALTWAVYLLCEHPDLQKQLREEVRANLPSISSLQDQNDHAGITAQMLDSLPLLNAVCSETLRVYAPVPLTFREAIRDTTILNQHVPKGTSVIIPTWAVNHSHALWGDDAFDFKPERWLGAGNGKTGGAKNNYAYMTFLHGPRSCIGQHFAKAEFAALLAALIGRFDFELEVKEKKEIMKGGITARPKGGLRVKLRAVDGW